MHDDSGLLAIEVQEKKKKKTQYLLLDLSMSFASICRIFLVLVHTTQRKIFCGSARERPIFA